MRLSGELIVFDKFIMFTKFTFQQLTERSFGSLGFRQKAPSSPPLKLRTRTPTAFALNRSGVAGCTADVAASAVAEYYRISAV